MYQAFSTDNGMTWTELKPARDLMSPCGPQSIRRLPGSSRLVCVFNDHRGVPFGSAAGHWHWRTPLTLAVSDDDAASWQVLGDVEDDTHNYCYTSLLFFGDDNLLLTDYESENTIRDGQPHRRNLATFKMQVLACRQFTA
jgi:hypothetical protein